MANHEAPYVNWSIIEPATSAVGTGLALARCLGTASLPNPAGQRTGRAAFPDRGARWRYGPNGSQHAASVPRRGSALLARPLIASQTHHAVAGRRSRRTAARPLARQPTRVREDHQSLDVGAGGRGLS